MSTPSAAMYDGRDPQRKREKKTKLSPPPAKLEPPPSLTSLPHDLLLNCLARVSRLHYPTLSLVSKQFRSVVASPELYETRSLLRRTERCLYLCLRVPGHDPVTYWYTLCQRPNRSLTKESTGNFLIQIPSPPLDSSNLVSFGSDIYGIGAKWPSPSSSRVSVLDCRFNTWRQTPSMRVKRSSDAAASLVDGKIYVAGGCEDVDSSNWVEFFDPKTQTWGDVSNPRAETRHERKLKSVGLGGKFYLFGDACMLYDPLESRWKPIGDDGMDMLYPVFFTYGVVGDTMFLWNDGVFSWYDCKAKTWKKVNGVEGLPDYSHLGHCKMVDLGGNMVVLWDGYFRNNGDDGEAVIWCAEIVLEMRDGGDEMWGKIQWFDAVLTIQRPCRVFDTNAISATV
ncbi:unnamed protein product [Cochlearia groenlandica]